MRLRGERDLLSRADRGAAPPERSPSDPVAALFVVTAAVLWGTTGTAQALLPTTEDALRPVVVGLARLALGGGALTVLAMTGGLARWRALASGRSARAAIVGVLAVVGYHVAFFTGVARLGVALGTVVTLGIAPLAAGLGAAVLERRRPVRSWAVATAAAVLGIGLLLRPGASAVPEAFGLAAALLAGLSYATYALASKRLLDLGVDGGVAMAALFGGGGAVALVALAPAAARASLATVSGSTRGPAILLWLGLASVALSYRLYARGLAGLEAERATTLTLAEPLTAALLGVALVGERLPGTAVLGGGLVLAGLVVSAFSAAARPRSATDRPAAPARPSGGA